MAGIQEFVNIIPYLCGAKKKLGEGTFCSLFFLIVHQHGKAAFKQH
jgi:hypothetical protein